MANGPPRDTDYDHELAAIELVAGELGGRVL